MLKTCLLSKEIIILSQNLYKFSTALLALLEVPFTFLLGMRYFPLSWVIEVVKKNCNKSRARGLAIGSRISSSGFFVILTMVVRQSPTNGRVGGKI